MKNVSRRHFLKTSAALGAGAIGISSFAAGDAEALIQVQEKELPGGGKVRWFETMLEMADGLKIYTYGNVPPEGEKCAIILQRNPYVAEEPVNMPNFAAGNLGSLKNGYAHICQHCRGCGMSEGDWIPYKNERADGLALLDWVRKLPFYNGEIFLTGGSYLSSVHLLYLDTNPPDVKGAVLSVQDCNRYNVLYRNGFFKAGLHGGWFVSGYKKKNHDLQRDRSVTFFQFPALDFSRRYFGEPVPELDAELSHPREDDPFWKTPAGGSDSFNALTNSTVPVLLTTNWYDIYTGGLFDMWERLSDERRAQCALLVGAYDHGGRWKEENAATPIQFPNGSIFEEFPGMESEWFDHLKKGMPLQKIPKGKITYFSLYENEWKSVEHLKNGPVVRRFYLNADKNGRKTLGPQAVAPAEISYQYDPRNPAPFPGGLCLNFGGMQIQPEPDFRPDVKSFLSEPFEEDADVQGRMTLHLVGKSDREDTCFYARLSLIKEDGKAYPLRDDISSLCYTTPDYTPGTEKTIDFTFSDHAFRIGKGERLRLDVSSSCGHFLPHTNVKGLQAAQREPLIAQNTVVTGKSFLTIYCN